jgi:hypothetical protein
VTLGLAVSGTIAVLEGGYRENYFSDLRTVYRQLLAANIWIDQKKLNQSLEANAIQQVDATDFSVFHLTPRSTSPIIPTYPEKTVGSKQ